MSVYIKNDSIMRKEILEQPELLLKSYDINKEIILKISSIIKEYKPKFIYFAARGSSEHACYLAQYIAEIYGGIPAKIINPSVITLYNSNLDMSNSVTIGVSQSGGAKDVALVLEHAKKQGAVTIAITNEQGVVNNAAEHNILLNIGKEVALPATKSYMTQAYLLSTIIGNMIDNDKVKKSIDNIPNTIKMALENEKQISEIVNYYRNSKSIFILSRGLTHAAMKEAELKVIETANVDARAYAASDYTHGPFSITNAKSSYFFVMVDETTNEFTLSLYKDMIKNNIFATVITNKEDIAKQFPLSILLKPVCEGIEGAFASVAVMQMFSCYLALYLGTNPDVPFGVSKSVVTV